MRTDKLGFVQAVIRCTSHCPIPRQIDPMAQYRTYQVIRARVERALQRSAACGGQADDDSLSLPDLDLSPRSTSRVPDASSKTATLTETAGD